MKPRMHRLIRFVALVVVAISVTYMAGRKALRADVTAEGLSRITDDTRELIAGIPEDRPVMVHAFLSEEVPRPYVPVRSRLLNILREMEAQGGDGLRVRVVAPEMHSDEAQEAIDKYGIVPRRMVSREAGRAKELQVFLGVAFVSGPREEVIPFLDRGLSVEYEVARALRMVMQDKKKVVGVLRTDAPLMGDFDMQARRQQPAWRIVDELRKQYEVRSLNPTAAIPSDVDVLLVPQLSSLGQEALDMVKAYVDGGRPALIAVDPLPLFDIRLAPSEPKLPTGGQGGGMFGQQQAPSEPKGDYAGLLRHFGVVWQESRILYDTYNPHPTFSEVPDHVIFVTERPDGADPFEDADPVVEGLEEVVVLFGGEIEPAQGKEDVFTPLLSTGTSAGFNMFDDMVQRHMLFGLQGPVIPRQRSPIDGKTHVLAARIQGDAPQGETKADSKDAEEPDKPAGKSRDLIVVADLDMFGDQFFAMHEQGGDIDGDGLDDIRFDNVPFLLNAVDSLANDDRFLALRKRRPEYRRLTNVEELTREARSEREMEVEAANAAAEKELAEAQTALDKAVDEIRNRKDLDETTQAIMIKSVEEAESRRLEAKQERIELDKTRTISRIEAEHRRKVDEVQDRIRLVAVLLPPLPALFMGAWIFARKRRRERETIPESRRRSKDGNKTPPAPAAPRPSGGEKKGGAA